MNICGPHIKSDIFDDLWAEVEEKSKVKFLSFPYIGARHLGYKGDKKIMTPADLKGIKLRMPPGEGWQFVGQAMGAKGCSDRLSRSLYRLTDRRHRWAGQRFSSYPLNEI